MVLLKAAAESRIRNLEDILRQREQGIVETLGDWDEIIPSLKAGLASCGCPWLLGQIITVVESHILAVFKMMYDGPLLPTYLHVYQHLVNNKRIDHIDDIESICETDGHVIFWNNRPLNELELDRSFQNWITTRNLRIVKHVVKVRHKDNLVFCIGSDGWRISRDTEGKFELPKTNFLDKQYIKALAEKLEEDHNPINTFALKQELGKRLVSSKDDVTRTCYLCNNRDSSSIDEVFPLKVSRLERCMDKRCSHCGLKESSQPYLRCGKCFHARYCSPECQKSDWAPYMHLCRGSEHGRNDS
jgi:hypothetical protein